MVNDMSSLYKYLSVLVLIVLFSGCSSMTKKQSIQTGQHPCLLDKTIEQSVTCDYLLYLPDDYSSKGEKWPMILFLHGAGERGDDLEKVKVHGPPKLIEAGQELPFIVVSPQCPEGRIWSNEVLIALVDDIVEHYNVDEDRIYLTGLSMGGFGTWSLSSAYPERFAAIAPICGGGMIIMSWPLKDMPVWVFHGAKDQTVPIEESERMVKALKKRGNDVLFTVYPDANHDSWTETYDNPKLFEWFLQHKRR